MIDREKQREKQLAQKAINDAYVAAHSGKKGKRNARRRLGYRYTRESAILRCVSPDRV